MHLRRSNICEAILWKLRRLTLKYWALVKKNKLWRETYGAPPAMPFLFKTPSFVISLKVHVFKNCSPFQLYNFRRRNWCGLWFGIKVIHVLHEFSKIGNRLLSSLFFSSFSPGLFCNFNVFLDSIKDYVVYCSREVRLKLLYWAIKRWINRLAASSRFF